MINFGNFGNLDLTGVIKKDAPYQTLTPVQDGEEEVVSLASPFDTDTDPYSEWFNETERNQRSPDGYTPAIEIPTTAPVAVTPAATPAPVTGVTPEMLERLEGMDLSGIGGDILGIGNKDLGGMLGSFQRENYYNNTTAYNPLGTDPEDMVVYDDLDSPEAKAAKAAREAELSESLQSWANPLKELSKSDPAQFGVEYSALPLTGQLTYLRNEFDNNEMTEREYQDAFAEQWNASGNAGTLKWIEKYGWRMYAPDAIAQQGGQDPNGPMDWYETEGLFDGSIDRLDQFTPRVKETFDVTSIGRGLLASPVLRLAAGVMSGGLSEGVIAAGKGLTGDTLHASDYLSIATAGLQLTDMVAPPVDAATAAEAGTAAMQAADAAGLSNTAAMAAGTAAQDLALAGKGLTIGGKALSYNQSMGLLTAAATGDPKKAIGALYGSDLVKGGLDAIGVTVDTLGDVQYNAVSQGLNKVVSKVSEGMSLDKALASGLVTYVKEDGTLGSIDLGASLDLDVSGLKKVVEDLVRPIGAIATDIAHFVEDATEVAGGVIEDAAQVVGDAGSAFDDAVLQPITQPVGDAIEDAAQVVGDAGSAFDDAVLQPVGDVIEDAAQATGDVVEDVAQVTGDVIEDVAQEVGDMAEDLAQAIGDIDLPDVDVDLPDVDLPDVDIDLPDLDIDLTAQQQAAAPRPSPTRTTDELFKFGTKIRSTQEMIDFSADPFAPDYRGL